MAGENSGNDAVPDVYESRPPPWLPKTHASADLGYSGFHPPRPGQDEDVLSEAAVKQGFIFTPAVPAETHCAQPTIHNRFVGENALTELEELMNQVFTRKVEQLVAIPPSSFRMPSRVTLNDAKRTAWFADLANPDVPLHKLGKSVPHGAKGHQLLDLLHENKIAIPRAVWFLRVFGANETAGLRNKPSYNPTQYSVEWANVMTSYMKKQLADIALPSAPRLALNIKQTFKGVLADADSREKWTSRFTYCLQLLRTFYFEGLVDNTSFLVWLVQQMGSCNLAQAGFLTRLADEYLDGMLCSRALVRPFIDACLAKLSEIRTTSAQEFLLETQSLIELMLQRICLVYPDAFVSPRTWNTHSSLLEKVLTRDLAKNVSDQHLEQNIREIQRNLRDDFVNIKTRNETMLFSALPTQQTNRLWDAVFDIQLLNSISNSTDLDTVAYFDSGSDNSPEFMNKLEMLLTWSITHLQFGDHRTFACVTLLHHWCEKAIQRASRRGSTPPHEFIQDGIFYWLDASEVAGEPDNIRSVAFLLDNLIQNGLFSYGHYLQRLIARGESGLSDAEIESRHRLFLRWIPLQKSSTPLLSQRKMTLYGARMRETPEDLTEREIRKEIRAIIPELFGATPIQGVLENIPTSRRSLIEMCPLLISAPRFEQVSTFRHWLVPILRKAFTNQAQDALLPSALLRVFILSVEIMALAKCFDSLLEFSLVVLNSATTTELLTFVLETIQQYQLIWTCKGAMSIVTAALHSAHHFWRTQGLQSRALLAFLMEADSNRHLNTVAREQVLADIASYTHALQPDTAYPTTVPAVLTEILMLANDPNPEAPSILANSLWYKYRAAPDWAWKVWDNTVASLRQIPVLIADTVGRRACALRYANFLLHVDEHLPNGFDDQVLRWFVGPGKREMMLLSSEAWDVFMVVIIYLSVNGALKTTTVLSGLIYPAWQLAVTASGGNQGQSVEIFLQTSNSLFRILLSEEESNGPDTPTVDLSDLQRIRTRRQEVYREPHFSALVSNIPTLIAIEKNVNVSEDLRRASTALRIALCADQNFCQGAHRNLDAIREAFEQPLNSDTINDEFRESLIDALCLVLWESREDIPSNWQNLSLLLSPWRLGATAIVLQFILKHMGRELSQEDSNKAVNCRIDELTLAIFRQSMTSKEAYFVAQMTKDVGNDIAGKFINNGLRCITDLLQNVPIRPRMGDLLQCVQRVEEILRVLAHIAEPLRSDPSKLPMIEPTIQDGCFNAICIRFKDVVTILSADQDAHLDSSDHSEFPQVVILLARLLQFDLGLRGVWTSNVKSAGSGLASTLFGLAMTYGAGHHLDTIVFPLLVDSLCYLLDEIPPDAKLVAYDPFQNYPKTSSSDLPIDMPSEYRSQLGYLLPHSIPNTAVADLMSAYRDATGALVHSGPLVNRPWEWVENLGEPATLDPKEEAKEREEKERLKTRYLVKNSGSLSLDAFLARVTGDGVISGYDDPREDSNVRSFDDGLSAESVFKRDWRETRVYPDGGVLPTRPGARGEEDGGSSSTGPTRSERRPRTSPASSVFSRASGQASGTGSSLSLRTSPGQPRGSSPIASEPIDVDAIFATNATTASRSEKRKAEVASDDDVEIVEGPVNIKARPKAAKYRSKKR